MLRALERSEDNIVSALKSEFGPAILTIGDHEQRLRILETEGSRKAEDAIEKAGEVLVDHNLLKGRVDIIEDTDRSRSDRRQGVTYLLTAGQKAIVLVSLILGIALVLINLIHAIVPVT